MKKMKKIFAILLALVMTLALGMTAFAQEISPASDNDKGTGSITITNAAKGEEYKVYRLFDACISTAQTDGKANSIAYTGTIPDTLSTYFSADTFGYITATNAAWKDADTKSEISDGLRGALKTWAESANEVASATSDGSQLKFNNLKYGYYVVISTQGILISVDSTNPSATIVDKNSTAPSDLTKKVNEDNVNIGDTVTYTVTFKTSNYDGAGTGAKKIISYTINDTLPEFLSNVTVSRILVDNDGNAATTDDQTEIKTNNSAPQFDDNKKIVIDWYDKTNSCFLYDNGATITITYTAVVTDKAAIDGDGNTNKVTVKWTTEGDDEPGPGELTDEEIIYTYAIALKKVDQDGKALAGAKFQFPFYVSSTPDTNGAYIYAGTESKPGLTNQITTPADGMITVKGVKAGTYSITELEAPSGYNKLSTPVSVTAVRTGKTVTNTTFYLDEDGNVTETSTNTTVKVENNNLAATSIVVVNKTGSLLPSTGGTGTAIFYILGAILVVGAGVMLVVRRRMSAEK